MRGKRVRRKGENQSFVGGIFELQQGKKEISLPEKKDFLKAYFILFASEEAFQVWAQFITFFILFLSIVVVFVSEHWVIGLVFH